MAKTETQKRILTGILLGFFCLAWVFLAPEPVYLGLSLLFLMISVGEYKAALLNKGITLRAPVLYGSVILAFTAGWCYWKGMTFQGNLAMTFALCNPIFFALMRIKKGKKLVAGFLLLPLIWLVAPYFMLVYLRYLPPAPYGAGLVFWLAMVVAANDIFAYFGGRRFGKTLLAPVISPKKTREGSAFGLLGGLVTGYSTQPLLMPFAEPWQIAALAIPLVVAAQAGDLAESRFKRYCGVKDSGSILPGHGGLLDRFDALLTTLPLYFILIYLTGLHHQW
ncbi:MAG: phosphatidate cytidylyltransferase [bacterium]|nr:phosphatidate cytidylyltransferase [bacterium]